MVNGVGISTWLGVPYGAAPVDDLRWKPVSIGQSCDIFGSVNQSRYIRVHTHAYISMFCYDDFELKPTNPQVWSDIKHTNSSFHCLEARASPSKNGSYIFMVR